MAQRAYGDTWRAMKPSLPPSPAAPKSAIKPLRVLIVEDHAPTRAAIAWLLEQEFPQRVVIGTASDGDAALRAVVEAPPEVVVLDLDLGGKSSLDLIPAISRDIAVIILTASDDLMARPRTLAAGAAAFVSKLSPAQELISAILAVRPELADPGALSYESVTQLPDK